MYWRWVRPRALRPGQWSQFATRSSGILDCHGIQTASCAVGNLFTSWEISWSGDLARSLHQLPATPPVSRFTRGATLLHAGYMGNQRELSEGLLCSINFSCRVLVQCIAAQTITRFLWEMPPGPPERSMLAASFSSSSFI